MKKLILISILVLGTLVNVQAQQIPLYSQYYYNPFLYNPAMAGANSFGNIFLIDRMQWTGIPGAPVTRALTIDGPVKENKVGLGLNIFDDQTDIFERIGVFGSYAYNIQFGEQHNLRLGLSAGYLDNRIDYSKVVVKDPKDNAILTQFENRESFDGTFGLNYQNKDLNIGFAVPQLFAPHLTYAPNSNITVYYSLVRHFIGSATYNFHFADNQWRLQPMVYAQFASGAPMTLDAGLNLKYKDLAWVGVLWRKDFAISASFGVKLHDRITLGYAYDIMTSAISPYAGGTHEIVIGYAFGKTNGAKAKEDEIRKKLDELNDKTDKNHRLNKTTEDSLKNELNKANRRIEKQDSIINNNRHNFDDFKKDMIDSLGKLRAPKKEGGMNAGDKSDKSGIPSYLLNNVNFQSEDAKLTSSSFKQLDDLGAILKANPNLKIEIDGYCDYRGTDGYNMTLSKARANAVRNYLIKHGVGKGQVTAVGFGKTKPVSDNSTPEGMAKNRRVEMKVLSK